MNENNSPITETNYPFEKQQDCIKNFAAEYSSFFLYKTMKRFFPPVELSKYDEEVVKARLQGLSKSQESKFLSIFAEVNNAVKMSEKTKDLFEIREKNEIMKEITNSPSKEPEEDWLDKKMLIFFNSILKKQLDEYF